MALKITATKGLGDLDNIFSKVAHVYYSSTIAEAKPDGTITVDFELPVIENSASVDTGGIDKTEVKLTTGQVWSSRATKADSNITLQIASFNPAINSLFLTQKVAGGYALDVKKSTGTLYFVDETGKGLLCLPKAEMYGALKLDGDNPGYYDVNVTPLINNEGVSIYIDTAEQDV